MAKSPPLTKAETELKSWLTEDGRMPGWRWQFPLKPFFVDFYHPQARLVIEVDGYHHWEPKKSKKDEFRSIMLRRDHHVLDVLRYSNPQVMERGLYVIEEVFRTYEECLRYLADGDAGMYRYWARSVK